MKSTPRYRNYALKMLHLYPRTWRERYENEAAAVLEERPVTLLTLFDLLVGMLDAYTHNALFRERNLTMTQQLRNNQVNIFSAFIFCSPFLVLYILFGPRMLPFWDLSGPIQAFIMPNTPFILQVSIGSALCALLASLLGGGALVVQMLKQALNENGTQHFGPFLWMLFSFLAFLLLTGVLIYLMLFRISVLSPVLLAINTLPFVNLNPHQTYVLLLVLSGLILMGMLTSMLIYARRKIHGTLFALRFLRLIFIPATLTVLAMLVLLCIQVYHVWLVDTHINALGWTLLSVPLLHIIVLCTAISTFLACISLWRAFKAQRGLIVT